jgi:hypothetical protein
MAHILDTCLITTKETPANRRSAWRCLLRSPAPDLLVCVTWLILMRLSCVLVRECLDMDCFIADLLVCVTWLILMKLPCVLVRECLNINFVIADLLVCVTGDYCPRTWFMSHMNESLQHTATHCNTLQHTATHCNTLQHTSRTWFSCSHMVVKTLLYCTRKCGCKGGCMSAIYFLQPNRNQNLLWDSPKFSLGLS